MVEAALLAAVALLIGGMIGSVVPLVPAGLLSLIGLWVYALFGAEPFGWLPLAGLTLAALVTIVLEQLGGPIAAKLGGSSNRTVIVATIGGVVCMFLLGPLGIIIGVVATVLLLELADGVPIETALRRAVYTGVGVLASSVAQLLLTGSILLAFLLFVVVL